ncbi:MAG: IS5 family transposase [Candidatus Omnitrophota bacterium]
MTQKRWGKKKKYPRDWKAYNEELVRRGTFYLDFDWVKSWRKELAEMNKNKVGAPYQFPESLIELQAVWHQLTNYRGVEGITRAVVEAGKLPQYNDFSTINRRVNKMNTKIMLPEKGDIYAATDGTGTKLNMSGEYFETKYGNGKKKFIKVIITANPITKDLLKVDASLEGEELSEPQVAMTHMAELEAEGYNILKFWGDGSFDAHELFDFLDYYNIEPAVKIGKDAVIDPGGSVRRNIEVRIFQELGYEQWAKEKEYGKRWLGTEGIISAVKRCFGERVRSKKEENMIKEAKRKFWAYEKMRKYAKA